MENQLFRKKSLEKISSPEEMHDYMRVTSPRLWMLLTAIVVLLAGFIGYAATTTLESVQPIKVSISIYKGDPEDDPNDPSFVRVYGGTMIPLALKESVSTGMQVRIGNEKGKITIIQNIMGDDEADGYIYATIEMDNDYGPLQDGVEYDAELVLESTTPISFLWNG